MNIKFLRTLAVTLGVCGTINITCLPSLVAGINHCLEGYIKIDESSGPHSRKDVALTNCRALKLGTDYYQCNGQTCKCVVFPYGGGWEYNLCKLE